MTVTSAIRQSSTIASTATTESVVKKLQGWRPRFFMLMTLFIAASSITVGVLGWRLTLNAAKKNISGLVEQIENLISDRVSAYMLDESVRLTDFVDMQKELFRTNQLSASTPERKNKTMRQMLILLNHHLDISVDIFYVTVPEGEVNGYTYTVNGTLQLWDQKGLTLSTYNCDGNGYALGAPVSVTTDEGNKTPQMPGNNHTLDYGIGGMSGTNLNYSDPNSTGMSKIRPWGGRIFKTSVGIAINEVTNEKVIVGADLSMGFLAKQLSDISNTIPTPLFVGVIGAVSGRMLASSPAINLLSADKTRMLDAWELDSIHVLDFSSYLNETYGTQMGYLAKVQNLAADLNAMQEDGGSRFSYRNVGGVDWILKVKSIIYGGKALLLLTYMDLQAFQKQVQETSDRTGYAMLGIILAFVTAGCLFAIVITRQLDVVARQIDMLKNLKFSEVLDKESGVKKRSFVFELAKLQEAFHEMVTVFAKTLKTNQSARPCL
ncbi:hypothetical protein BCR33DRAFT_764451 [Rhizoclosmatium globosum]|uniref:Uncharacterized protein n=1 Tax=Rhizoclosmatium globosum TaxID=329046 RepID=A0A1Y2CKH1_9FUNG|nr:hypothetical protein BCR33DRAFT_764451 [Rhizoclosmatium globosum]|eukprot:ORY47457.1 hypothetical protein BCR33DRAFT_764451 [Rhizoclosmatium globosum]